MKIYLFFALASLTAPCFAETVVVWDFATRDGKKTDISANLTYEFEEALAGNSSYMVLERRKLDRLRAVIENEKALQDIGQITSAGSNEIKQMGVSTVVFGEVFDDIDSGDLSVTVTFQDFTGRKQLIKSVLMRRGLVQDATSRRERMAALVEAISAATPKTATLPRQSAKLTCSTKKDSFDVSGDFRRPGNTGGYFGVEGSVFYMMVGERGSGDKRCPDCRVTASTYRVAATVWADEKAASWGLYVLDMSEVRGEWYSFEVEPRGRASIKHYRDGRNPVVLWAGTYAAQKKDRLSLEAREGTLIATANGAEVGRATYNTQSILDIPLGVGFVMTTGIPVPATAWFDDYELTTCDPGAAP